MALGIASIRKVNGKIQVIKGYDPIINDFTCNEISNNAKELKLGCLRYLDGAEDLIFNYSQRQEILMIEIPALRTKNLSIKAYEALNGLEYAIKDMKSSRELLSLEGD